MPLFDYKCSKCGKKFSELVKDYKVKVTCPDCKSDAERDYAVAPTGSFGKKPSSCTGNCSTCSGCNH